MHTNAQPMTGRRVLLFTSAPQLERVTGRDFDNGRSAELRCDAAAACRLWQVSADLVGLIAPTQPR